MPVSSLKFDAPFDEIRALILQPEHYSYWVLGPQVVVEIDDAWPTPGSGFATKVGGAGLELHGRTELLADAGDVIRMHVDLAPLVVADVTITLHRRGDRTLVKLEEDATGGLAALGWPITDLALRWRNQESLARLRALAERRGAADDDSQRATLSGAAVFDRPEIGEVLTAASTCYLAVASPSGPHVTPARFAVLGDRLWSLVGSSSVKATSLKKRPVVSVTATAGKDSIVVQGQAVVIDPTDPIGALRALSELSLLSPALLKYLVRNVTEVTTWLRAIAGGLTKGTAGGMPSVVAVRPEGGALFRDGELVPLGRWLDRRTSVAPREAEGSPAVLGWSNEQGVVALPVRWNGETARVSRALAELVEADMISDAALTFDRADDMRGVMMRGKGELVPAEDLLELRLDTEKITYWDGTETGTVTT